MWIDCEDMHPMQVGIHMYRQFCVDTSVQAIRRNHSIFLVNYSENTVMHARVE